MRKLSSKWFQGLGSVWVDGDIINQKEQARNSRLREEVDEFTFGYFEFGTFMSPRFLFLDFRNLKTKWVGFGMKSSIFPQILFHCSYNKKELVAVESPTWRWHMRTFWVCVRVTNSHWKSQGEKATDPGKISGTCFTNVLAINTTICSCINTTKVVLPYP